MPVELSLASQVPVGHSHPQPDDACHLEGGIVGGMASGK